jgi:hypothetical protein
MPKTGELLRLAEIVRVKEAALRDAVVKRHEPGGDARWQSAAESFNVAMANFDSLRQFDVSKVRLHAEPDFTNAMVLVEARPYCHRSGYAIVEACYALANCSKLTPAEKKSLHKVIITMILEPRAREMWPVGRLAFAVWSERLCDELMAMSDGSRLPEGEKFSERPNFWGGESYTPAGLNSLDWSRGSSLAQRAAAILEIVEHQRRTVEFATT